MLKEKKLNGVDVQAVENTVHAIEENGDIAKFNFRIKNKWISGGNNESTVTNFYGACKDNDHLKTFVLEADEPPLLAGGDSSAGPAEHLLHALASCVTTTLVYHAALRNIKIEELESEVDGDIDLHGFTGLSDDVRKGFENIRVRCKVKTDSENIEQLKTISTFSPVLDSLANGLNVDVQIEKK